MTRSSQGKASACLLAVMVFVALTGFTAWAFASPAFSAKRLAAGFARFGDPERAGIREEDLPLIAGGIAGYLRGDVDSPQVQLKRNGEMQPAFSRQELDHMPDVKRLTDWARNLMWLGMACALCVFLWAVLNKAALGKPLLRAGALFFCLMGALGAWALIDFAGLFTWLHRLLFPNELWLLDPHQHLMIQLMPEPFFVDYALGALRRMAALVLIFPLAGVLLYTDRKKAKK